MTKIRTGATQSFWILPVTVFALLLAGCSKEPGGQVVAVVNDQEITQQEVRAQAVAEGIPASVKFKDIAPSVLERVIERNLMADYARDQGLDRSPEFIALRRQTEQTMLAGLTVEKLAGPQTPPTPEQIRAYIANNPSLFGGRENLTIDQLRMPTPEDPARLKELTKLNSLVLIEAQLKNDGVAVSRSIAQVDTASLAPEIARQIVSLPPNEIFDISVGGETAINVIKSRSPIAGDPTQWNAIAAGAVSRQAIEKVVGARVAAMRKSATVKIAPEYRPKPEAKR